MKARLASLPGECVLVFDRNDNLSPKDHERMRRRSGLFELQYTYQQYSSSDTFLKNKHKTLQLSRVFSTFDISAAVTIDTQDTGLFGHEEIISYVLQAVGEGKNVVGVLCDDTDVFMLLVFWMRMNQLVDKCQMQMGRCDGVVLIINQTCTTLGSKCLQLLEMLPLTGYDTTSFPFNKGKVSALRVLEAGYFLGLFHVLREEDDMQWDLLEVGLSYFLLCTARSETRHTHGRGEV